MRIDRRFLQWGVFFIALGLLPLGVQAGLLNPAAVADVARIWPVLLIAIGLGLLLARTPYHFVGGLLVAVTFGLIIGGGLAGGVGAIGCVGGGSGATAFPPGRGTFGTKAAVDISVDCGSASLTTAPGSNWGLSGTSDRSRQPRVVSSADLLSIDNRRGTFLGFGAAKSDWRLQLPTDPTLAIALGLNGATATLDLAGIRLDELQLTTNAGSARIDLSGAASVGSLDATINAGDVVIALPPTATSASVTVNAGHIGFCAPPGVGLTIETSGALAGNNFADRGLSQDGNTWTSPGYASAAIKTDLQVTVNAGSVELDPDGGCK